MNNRLVVSRLVRNMRGNQTDVARFCRDETGTMLVFGLFIFVITLVASGMAIDFMRHEATRVKLQTTLDRAVLAAADISQELEAEDVIEDHFAKAGLGEYYSLDAQRVGEKTVTYSEVAARASNRISTFFLKLIGIDDLGVHVAGGAAEREMNIEISMVLDISGTMAHYSTEGSEERIKKLKVAASEFLEIVLAGEKAKRTSVNLITYSGSVNPGEDMFRYLGGDRDHSHSSCIEMTDTDFTFSGLPTGSNAQVPHFNYYPTDDPKYPGKNAMMDWGWCPSDDMSIIYASNRLDQLLDAVDNIRLHDGTGTHIGMKYGLALLDPTTQPFFQAQTLTDSQGLMNEFSDPLTNIPKEFADRPGAWTVDGEVPITEKYIVLMTDGNVSKQYRPEDPDDPELETVALNKLDDDAVGSEVPEIENVTKLKRVCDEAAKFDDVTVYTVAFDPWPAKIEQYREEMQYCATGDSTYYEVYGDGLVEAFKSIARSVNKLRLTN